MTVYEFEGRVPVIDESAYIFPNSTIIGDVRIGKETWIGPGAVLRGDYGTIVIGDGSAVEDNCVIHARPGEKTTIGNHVTIGHLSVIHTGNIHDWAVIGMQAVVSDFSVIGQWAAIGEGAVIKSKFEVPDESIAVGVPAKIIGKIDQNYKDLWIKYKANYNSFCQRYRKIEMRGV